ncbi:hypothetical protein [Streptosporangium roseum]|uniref:hypothetical protein n=1 Tax=Streptosporangium roseum TaxID=2001 RepID=UPI003323CCC5
MNREDGYVADWAKLIEAIANLVGALAWPIAVVLAVWLIMRRHQMAFGRLIDRLKSFSFPGGQIDLTEIEAAQQVQVDNLVEQAVNPDADEAARRNAVHSLSKEAEQLGRIRTANGPFIVCCPNCAYVFSTKSRRQAKCPHCWLVVSIDYLRAQAQNDIPSSPSSDQQDSP